jgi:carboxypeptidase Q
VAGGILVRDKYINTNVPNSTCSIEHGSEVSLEESEASSPTSQRPSLQLSHFRRTASACFLVTYLLLQPSIADAQTRAGEGSEQADLASVSRLRDEGLNHSSVMEYAEQLADEIGPRLTGSPQFEEAAQWAVRKLQDIGSSNVHEESWGNFGMAWTQLGTTLLLELPSPAALVAQATPWSPSTNGQLVAPVMLVPRITAEDQLADYKGKLRGKIILYGLPPIIDLSPESPIVPADDTYFRLRMNYPLETPTHTPQDDSKELRDNLLRRTVAKFFADQGALAVLHSPLGGDAYTFRDDDSFSMGWLVFQKEHQSPIPSAVVAPDSYGRLFRLSQRNVPVTIKLNIDTKFGADHVDGQNVLGEIPGSDPALKNQVVLFGAHLDSWASATGATDNGAGVAIALEALRILKASGIKPRRTIRIGLWGGEEEGELGSLAYVDRHFAKIERSSSPSWKDLPEWQRPAVKITESPDYRNLDVYFNVDAGAGRVFGIFAENNLAAAAVFRQWLEPVHDLGVDKVSTLHRQGVDMERFDAVGLPGFQLMQDIRDYDTRTHHTNLDNYDRISGPDLKQAATVMAIFAFDAAQREAMIPRKLTTTPAGNSGN